MFKDITVEELQKYKEALLIDVRSEKEYAEGTVPKAINMPVFNNEERAKIGEIYNKESIKKAMELGLEIASQKLPYFYREIQNLAGKRPIILFCWRGGMRSKSLATVLDLMGMNVYRLVGGYKAFRRYIVDFFARDFTFQVVNLKGNTGTGKTRLLRRLKQDGYPVLDLEGLSNNRGSVFGHIGLGDQPTQKQFEALLFEEISQYKNYPYLLVECESKRIGKVLIPDSLFKAMENGLQILVYDDLDRRAERLVQEYASKPQIIGDIESSLIKLKKRLGKAKLEELSDLLKRQDYLQFARELIKEYYDKLYGYPNEPSDAYDLCISSSSEEKAVVELKSYLNSTFLNLTGDLNVRVV